MRSGEMGLDEQMIVRRFHVAIEQPHRFAAFAQSVRKVHREGGLAGSAFSARDNDRHFIPVCAGRDGTDEKRGDPRFSRPASGHYSFSAFSSEIRFRMSSSARSNPFACDSSRSSSCSFVSGEAAGPTGG